jgi:hypothetical protein
MQTLTPAMRVAFLAGTHADLSDGTASDPIASPQGICIDMDDYGSNVEEVDDQPDQEQRAIRVR